LKKTHDQAQDILTGKQCYSIISSKLQIRNVLFMPVHKVYRSDPRSARTPGWATTTSFL